jgi:hypothetical protein
VFYETILFLLLFVAAAAAAAVVVAVVIVETNRQMNAIDRNYSMRQASKKSNAMNLDRSRQKIILIHDGTKMREIIILIHIEMSIAEVLNRYDRIYSRRERTESNLACHHSNVPNHVEAIHERLLL